MIYTLSLSQDPRTGFTVIQCCCQRGSYQEYWTDVSNAEGTRIDGATSYNRQQSDAQTALLTGKYITKEYQS